MLHVSHNYLLSISIALSTVYIANFSDTITDEMMRRLYKPDVVLADIPRANDPVEYKLADVPVAEKLEKFLEDVK